MGYLLSQPDLTDDHNPVGPQIIGTAFRTACNGLESDIEVKLTLFKMFDKFAGHGIHQMYCDINDFLVRRDVLPTISTSIRPHGAGGKTRVIIESEDGQIEATGSDVFSTLQGLMTNPATGMPNGAGFAHAGAMGAGSLGAATGGYPGATGIPGSPGTTGGGPMGSNTLGGSPNTGQGGVSARGYGQPGRHLGPCYNRAT